MGGGQEWMLQCLWFSRASGWPLRRMSGRWENSQQGHLDQGFNVKSGRMGDTGLRKSKRHGQPGSGEVAIPLNARRPLGLE